MANSHTAKVAVITGAAAGLGQAYATRLAADGAAIVAADREAADEPVSRVKAAGGSAIAVSCDVSKPAEVAALAQAVEAQFGRCDILVNNAGIYPIQTFAWAASKAPMSSRWRRASSRSTRPRPG